MSVVQVISGLVGVAWLASYLCIKHRQRVRSRFEPYAQRQRTGAAIDVATLKPRIDAVRHDYLSARQPTKGLWYHRALLKVAGQAVAQLGYFRDRKTEDQSHTHAA
jgi:hypothetical protein